ncbi:MAG: hypothetical protein HY432_02055 [Candidatus Liptonbacteria bacterium]|nr:hypothetical protein [Candidatus Liptonbacteria bacterium]
MDFLEKNIIGFNRQLTERTLWPHNLQELSGGRPDALVIAGMGGSGLAGNLIKAVKKEIGLNIPVITWNDYGLPDISGPEFKIRRPLYIFASFSGNTEETLSGLKTLLKTKKKVLAATLTTGGELKKISEEKGIPMVSFFSDSLTPRQSVGIMFYGLGKLLKAAGLKVKVKDCSKNIKPARFKKAGKKIASTLKGKTVCIYTDEKHRHLGYIWKIKINETAKNPAFNNVLPEMNHNELVGFDSKKFKTAAIFLKSDLHPRMGKRLGFTEKLLKNKGVKVIELKLEGKTELEKIWNMMILADWTSYFLGKLNGVSQAEFNIVNPKIVSNLKQLMK